MEKTLPSTANLEDYISLFVNNTGIPVLGTKSPDKAKPSPSILHTAVPVRIMGQMISRLISETHFVLENVSIRELVHSLRRKEYLHALGVTDHDGKVLGIIDLKEMFSLLGKPYCQEVYFRRPVTKIMKSVRTFRFDENIFSIAESLSDDLQTGMEKYYCLADHDNSFTGIFSIRDLLIYLAAITNKDINLARRLQSGMVKDHESVKTETFEAMGLTRIAKGIGGDFYYIRKYAENRWIFAIGDVSGRAYQRALSLPYSGACSPYTISTAGYASLSSR